MAPESLTAALVRRLRRELPRDVLLSLYGPLVNGDIGDLPPETLRAASPADLAARSEVLFVVVDDLDTIEALIGGPSGVQAGTHSPTVLIVGGTCAPEALRGLAGRLHSTTAGLLTVIDAPLTARPEEIRAGQVPILAGAPPSVFARAETVLALLGPTTRVGGVGSGQVAAACTQFLLASNAALLVEAALLAQRSGLDLDRLFTTWQAAAVPARMLTEVHERMVGKPDGHIPMRMWAGPLAVARAEARRTQTRSTLLTTVGTLYDQALHDGDPDADLLQRLLQVLGERRVSVPAPALEVAPPVDPETEPDPETTDPSRTAVGTADDPGQDDRSD